MCAVVGLDLAVLEHWRKRLERGLPLVSRPANRMTSLLESESAGEGDRGFEIVLRKLIHDCTVAVLLRFGARKDDGLRAEVDK